MKLIKYKTRVDASSGTSRLLTPCPYGEKHSQKEIVNKVGSIHCKRCKHYFSEPFLHSVQCKADESNNA